MPQSRRCVCAALRDGSGVSVRRNRASVSENGNPAPVTPLWTGAKSFGVSASERDSPKLFAPGEAVPTVNRLFASDGRFSSYKHGGGVSDVSIQRRQFQAMPGGQVGKIVVSDFIRFVRL